jgi:uncharacterized protein (TIGR02147 family)
MNALDLKSNFRELLQDELVRRIKANPRYSLRAYAKSLNIDSSLLSKILRQLRPISNEYIKSMGLTLKLSPKQIKWYEHAESMPKKNSSDLVFKLLDQDSFEIISDWYHFAILEMMNIEGFKPELKWLATRLALSKIEVQAAIERLQRVGLLIINEEGQWIDQSKGHRSFNLGPEYSSAAHRNSQKQILEKSMKALEELPLNIRDHSSMMMATNPEKIMEAKKLIDQFRYELCRLLEDTDKKKNVYQLSIGLFPITN